MGLIKRVYTDEETLITAQNLNDIQDAVINLEDGLFSIDNTKSGEVITITDAYKRGFRSLSIFGRTTQDGTPTPDNPVDLVSVGDGGSITVNVNGENEAQSVTVSTPNGLPGIPVDSGGNYTDAKGQQWICDEVDLARGVCVHRIDTLTPQSAIKSYNNSADTNRVVVVCDDAAYTDGKVIGIVMCDSLPTVSANDQYSTNESCISVAYNNVTLTIKDIATEDAVTQWLTTNPIKILYARETPIEIPLSAEEIAAYSALHTYKDLTTVSNDASAHMELEYVMDSKKYFDSLSTGGIIPATVE